MNLPPFPIDEQTLDLLHRAVRPGPRAERSSLGDLCGIFSEMAGADLDARQDEPLLAGISFYRDPTYHPNDIIAALVEEIRRLRRRRPAARLPRDVTPAMLLGAALERLPHNATTATSRVEDDQARAAITLPNGRVLTIHIKYAAASAARRWPKDETR